MSRTLEQERTDGASVEARHQYLSVSRCGFFYLMILLQSSPYFDCVCLLAQPAPESPAALRESVCYSRDATEREGRRSMHRRAV